MIMIIGCKGQNRRIITTDRENMLHLFIAIGRNLGKRERTID